MGRHLDFARGMCLFALEMTSKVAVIGCGYWGKNLVRNFAELDALGAVADVTEEGRDDTESVRFDPLMVQMGLTYSF